MHCTEAAEPICHIHRLTVLHRCQTPMTTVRKEKKRKEKKRKEKKRKEKERKGKERLRHLCNGIVYGGQNTAPLGILPTFTHLQG